MYEFIILALLMRRPAHGYLLAKIIGDIIGPFARASNGRIYPLLANLEAAGLITGNDASSGGRALRAYQITESGRRRFRELMLDTASSPREYQEVFSFKVTVMEFIAPAERLQLIEHYIGYCQAHIRHLQGEARDVEEHRAEYYQDPTQGDALVGVLEHLARRWELELAWAEGLRQKHAAGV